MAAGKRLPGLCVTVLVLASAGRTTQALTSRRKNKEAAHD